MKNKLMILSLEQKEFENDVKKLELPNLELIVINKEEDILKNIENVNIILANPNLIKKYLHLVKKLEWLQITYTGVDSIVSECKDINYIVTNTRGVYGKTISEYVFGYVFTLEKEIIKSYKDQKDNNWNRRFTPSIVGKTLGVIGVGSIGKEVGRVGKTFGMKTLGLSKSGNGVEYFDEIYKNDSIKEFCSKIDYLVLALPNTKETENIINKTILSHMKKSVVLINVGRGNSINEEDLIDALKTKTISYAVLDVFREEPLPKEHPFWNLENCIVTPHISGYVENNDGIINVFKDNYMKFNAGEKLNFIVDFMKGY